MHDAQQHNAAQRRDRRLRSASLLIGAAGCLGIGALLGGWTAEQPASRMETRAGTRTNASVQAGTTVSIAVDARNDFLYRALSNGRIERLPLGQGVTASGTSAQWQLFKAP